MDGTFNSTRRSKWLINTLKDQTVASLQLFVLGQMAGNGYTKQMVHA
jgi:hypothetical protein